MATTRTFDENCATATAQLSRFADAPLLHLIDGQPTPSASGETFDNHSPIDGALLGAVAAGRSRRHRCGRAGGVRRVRRLVGAQRSASASGSCTTSPT